MLIISFHSFILHIQSILYTFIYIIEHVIEYEKAPQTTMKLEESFLYRKYNKIIFPFSSMLLNCYSYLHFFCILEKKWKYVKQMSSAFQKLASNLLPDYNKKKEFLLKFCDFLRSMLSHFFHFKHFSST